MLYAGGTAIQGQGSVFASDMQFNRADVVAAAEANTGKQLIWDAAMANGKGVTNDRIYSDTLDYGIDDFTIQVQDSTGQWVDPSQITGGWTQASYEVKLTRTDNPDPSAQVTLFINEGALPTEYTVTYNYNQPTLQNTTLTIQEGQSLTQPATPEVEGYVFVGWFSDQTLTQAWDFTSPVTANLTLYAKWSTVETPAPIDPPVNPAEDPVVSEPTTNNQPPAQEKAEQPASVLPQTGDASLNVLACLGIFGAVSALLLTGSVLARRRG